MTDQPADVEDLDVIGLSGAKAKGKRPYFFSDADVERVMSITMAVAGEVAVLRARMDTIETLLENQGTISQADIDAFVPNEAQMASRGQWNQEYIARILRIVQQERESNEAASESSAEEVGHQLAQD